MSTALDPFDLPLGGLTGMPRLQLSRTHMEAAIAEVRFVSGVSALPEEVAIAVWDGLGRDTLPVFESHSVNTLNLTVSPQGADSTSQVEHGWVLASSDRRTSVTLLPSMVAVQTSAYERYSTSLGAPLRLAVQLFVDATGASLVQRIGLRYINRLQDNAAHEPDFWRDHVRAPFAGPLTGDLAPIVEMMHQQVLLRLEPTAAARINSGVFREEGADARWSFLIDLDVFREQAFSFDPDLCEGLARQLNRTAFPLFCQVLSDKYLDSLGPVQLEEVTR